MSTRKQAKRIFKAKDPAGDRRQVAVKSSTGKRILAERLLVKAPS